MKQVFFDFENIQSLEDFYNEAFSELMLPDYFGYSLDALWDCLMGDIELPIEVFFINMTLKQVKDFEKLIRLFQDAENELVEGVFFDYSLKDETNDDDCLDTGIEYLD